MKAPPVELVFVVRMWVQGGDVPGTGRWRGDVLDVFSGLRFYIVVTGDIADFIAARLEQILSE